MNTHRSLQKSTGGSTKKWTFSSAPYVPRAKRQARSDYTHSDNRLIEIGRENTILVKKLTDINHRDALGIQQVVNPVEPLEPLQKLKPVAIAPASVNRRRSEGRIAQENMFLYRRLQAIRPSSEIRRDVLEKRHMQNQRYKDNCSTFGRFRTSGKAPQGQERQWQ